MKFRLLFAVCLVGLVVFFTAWLMSVFDLEVTVGNVAMILFPFSGIVALTIFGIFMALCALGCLALFAKIFLGVIVWIKTGDTSLLTED
jgi:hypothetical protein